MICPSYSFIFLSMLQTLNQASCAATECSEHPCSRIGAVRLHAIHHVHKLQALHMNSVRVM